MPLIASASQIASNVIARTGRIGVLTRTSSSGGEYCQKGEDAGVSMAVAAVGNAASGQGDRRTFAVAVRSQGLFTRHGPGRLNRSAG